MAEVTDDPLAPPVAEPATKPTQWSEGVIARAVCMQTLRRQCVVLVDRCNWTGHECDLLAVTTDLRIIDVEVKISRADFKADASKDKWWHRQGWAWNQPKPEPVHRDWPPKVWKHYIAMPAELWTDDLFERMPSTKSGLLLVRERRGGAIEVNCRRRATPNKDAAKISPASVIDIARLANLRMWNAYEQADAARKRA